MIPWPRKGALLRPCQTPISVLLSASTPHNALSPTLFAYRSPKRVPGLSRSSAGPSASRALLHFLADRCAPLPRPHAAMAGQQFVFAEAIVGMKKAVARYDGQPLPRVPRKFAVLTLAAKRSF